MLNYIGTRDVNHKVSFVTGKVLDGLATDGGTYVPEDLAELKSDYKERLYETVAQLKKVFGKFFPDYGEELTDSIVTRVVAKDVHSRSYSSSKCRW